MTERQHIAQEDLALYALQALSKEESAAVRGHLSTCALCRSELAALEGDLAMVALSVKQHPLPEGAEERFAKRISEDRDSTVRRPADVVLMERERRTWPAGWFGWIAAAAILLVCVGLGFEIAHLQTVLDEKSRSLEALQASRSRAEELAELLTSPAAKKVLLSAPKTPPAPTGRAVYLPARGELIFQANNLPSIPSDKSYELWVIPANGSAPTPAGLFRPDASGSGVILLPQIPVGVEAKAFGVTLENAAGAKSPTAPILLMGAVPPSGQ